MSYPPPNPDASHARLSAQLESIRNDFHAFTDALDSRLERIEVQTTATNGRVRQLEAWQIREEATAAADAKHADGETTARERRMRWLLAGFAVLGSIISGVTVAAITVALLPT